MCAGGRSRPLIIVFALAGLFVSVLLCRTAHPSEHHGLGEPGVPGVGPLMIVGTFLAATGTIPGWVLLVSVPYALIVTAVRRQAHRQDRRRHEARCPTLPAILGGAARVVGHVV